MSPQGEWMDLEIDLAKPNHEDGWTWNSGFAEAARVDSAGRTWYGAMRIPFSDSKSASPRVGKHFRINRYRSQGRTFHVPERFGLLQLIEGAQ
jgi:hypothetical protein